MSGLFLLGLTVIVAAQPIKLEVQEAKPNTDQRTKEPVVSIKLSKESAEAWAKITTQNVGKPTDLRVNGRTVSQPVIREPMFGGSFQISGSFTVESAAKLASELSSGATIEVELSDLTKPPSQ